MRRQFSLPLPRALLSLAALAYSSAAPAFTCDNGNAALSVHPDGSYAVAVGGAPWLTSGAVAIHASSTFFVSSPATPPPSDMCAPVPDIDCVGNDIRNTTTSANTPSKCCAYCKSVSGCKAWSLQSDGHCFAKDGCAHPVHVPGGTSGVSGDSVAQLVLQRAEADNGSDDAGEYMGWSLTWAGNASSGAHVSVVTSFLCYATGFIAFETTWPDGAQSTSTADGSPIAHFPSFASAGALANELRLLHVSGIWTLFEVWGTGSGSIDLDAGTDSPLWLLNATAPEMGTLILAPLDSFKAQVVRIVRDPASSGSGGNNPQRLVAGPYTSIESVPVGFSSRYAIWPSKSGVSAAAFEWGAALQRMYKTRRLPQSRDVLNEKLSYWSDNGATLFQSFWDVHCPTRNCTEVSVPNGTNAENMFIALKASHVADKIPASIYQLDTWWFTQWADRQPGGSLDCAEWAPRADLWPHGLPYVTQHDIPLLLYSWGWVTPEHGNTMTNYTWIPSSDGREAMVALDEVYSFYSMIRDRFRTFNGTSYETDNTASFTSGWLQTRNTVDAASRYWEGFASPWCEEGIPVQTCESTAGDLLETLKWGCVTSQRDTIDDVPGKHNASPLTPGAGNEVNFLHRWRVGHDRLLMGALAQRPFFDNVWSTPWQNQSTWAGDEEVYVELAWVLSVFTAGAVGFGDYPGDSNRTLIMTACRDDGTLLSASVPSYYVDAVYLSAGTSALIPTLDPTVGRLYQAPSFVPDSPAGAAAAAAAAADHGNYDLSFFTTTASADSMPLPYHTVLAIDINATALLPPGALTPDLSGHPQGYVATPWARGFAATASACADGAPAGGCVIPFSTATPLDITTFAPPNNYTHFFEMWTLSPVYGNGFALLGELTKVIRIAPRTRITWVAPDFASAGPPPTLSFGVVGSSGEAVSISVLSPPSATDAEGIVRVVPLTFSGGGGEVLVTCRGVGAACACAVTPA